MRIPFGYKKVDGNILIDPNTSLTVQYIAELYLGGFSLGRIANTLEKERRLSPSGNMNWCRSVIDSILSNPQYCGSILTEEQYFEIQFEKDRRSNKQDNNRKKTTRYHSMNVLSGLVFCSECNAVYRRITRPNKEIVWRCANRVEHGSRLCHHSPSIKDSYLKKIIMECIGIEIWNEEYVKSAVSRIEVDEKSQLVFTLPKTNSNMNCNFVGV